MRQLKSSKEKDGTVSTQPSVKELPHVSDGIFVRNGEFYQKILFADILWLKADNNYCELHIANNKSICVIHPLARVEKKLPAGQFVRIHRSYIVNILQVDRFVGNIVYIGKKHLDVSRPYRHVFSCFDVVEDDTKITVRTEKPINRTEKPINPIIK